MDEEIKKLNDKIAFLSSDRDNLIEKNRRLKEELTLQRENNHRRNIELDALHYVWCDGGCEGGVHRWTDKSLTREIVEASVRNTKRLVSWWNNHEFRKLDYIEPTIKDVNSYRHTYHNLYRGRKMLKFGFVAAIACIVVLVTVFVFKML